MQPLAAATSQSMTEDMQYLTFLLNQEEYGLELLSIQEIRGYTTATPIPNVSPYVKGVINLRGTVLPIVDLRIAFGLSEVAYDKFTVIVVTRVGSRLVGLLVDAVSDVMDVKADGMQPPPDFGSHVDTRFIQGLFPTKAGLAVALDLHKLLNANFLCTTPAEC